MIKGQLEKELLVEKHKIVGIDEVGRGCIAGPVYAAAVVLDYRKLAKLESKNKDLIRDSKKLSPKQRAAITPYIIDIAESFSIKSSSVCSVETLGIVPATEKAMFQALSDIQKALQEPLYLLIDGSQKLSLYDGMQQSIIKGDSYCYCIAAASILAKEARDQQMREIAEKFPQYGFEKHVGYGTKFHKEAIEEWGPCVAHRRNFEPIKSLVHGLS